MGLGRGTALAPLGYSEWLRSSVPKAFIVFSDDDEGGPDDQNPLTPEQFVEALTELAPEHFGTPEAPNFSFHSVVGLKEKADPSEIYLPSEPIEMELCSGGGAAVPVPGLTYQALSIATGGVRFPICTVADFDVAFEAIARQIADTAELCEFAIPEPPDGSVVDPDAIGVRLEGSGAGPEDLVQVPSVAACADGSFYVDAGRIHLCPGTCDRVRAEPPPRLEVLLACH